MHVDIYGTLKEPSILTHTLLPIYIMDSKKVFFLLRDNLDRPDALSYCSTFASF